MTPASPASRRRALRRKAECVAFQYYLRRGAVPSELVAILRATSSDEALAKFNPNHDPTNGQFTFGSGGAAGKDPNASDYPTSSVKTLADAQKIVADSNGNHLGKNGECASLTHALAPDLPPASAWIPGDKVQGNTDIPIGTPIATFNFTDKQGNATYGSTAKPGGVSGDSHTGIYLGQNKDGIEILHQYQGRKGYTQISNIPWGAWGKNGTEGGSRYYTIDYKRGRSV